MVTEIASIDHFNRIIRQDNVSVIDYHAPWSGTSKAMLPTFTALAKAHQKINFYKLDIDEHAQLTQEAGSQIYPTFVAYRNGAKIETVCGANPAALETLVQKALRS